MWITLDCTRVEAACSKNARGRARAHRPSPILLVDPALNHMGLRRDESKQGKEGLSLVPGKDLDLTGSLSGEDGIAMSV